jgi:hypothetical protein
LPPGGFINIGGGGDNQRPGSININPGGGNVYPNNPGNPGGYFNPGPGINIATKQCLNGGYRTMDGLPCICPKGYYGDRCDKSNFGGGGGGSINIGGGGINIGGNACYNNPCRNGVGRLDKKISFLKYNYRY